VDVRLRETTRNAHSADDVLRGLVAGGGDGTQEWSIPAILAAGDRATGTTVLSRTYQEMAAGDHAPDLPDLWRRLGIEKRGDRLIFHDDAPLAAVRKEITKPRK
jgi:predicted metalloprotease with PDZ domain